MLDTDGQYRLVFNTQTDTDLATLIKELAVLNFIGAAIFKKNDANEYCVGDAFLSDITFMGCSPYIEFEPPQTLGMNDVANFCFIRLSSTRQPDVCYHQFQLTDLKTVPRCKQCRKVITDWIHQATNLENDGQVRCVSCNKLLNKADLDWRKASGTGNIFIEVLNVYLQEAVPTDAFMQQLEQLTSSSWQYFYTDSNIKTKLLDIS